MVVKGARDRGRRDGMKRKGRGTTGESERGTMVKQKSGWRKGKEIKGMTLMLERGRVNEQQNGWGKGKEIEKTERNTKKWSERMR